MEWQGCSLGKWISLGAFLLLTNCVYPQLMKEQPGPGLDSSPIVIPSVESFKKRPITTLDLLQMRDLRGLSISPDSKQIAFIVSQAVLDTNKYRTALFVVGTEVGSQPVNYGSVGPPFWSLLGQWLPEAPQWSPDSKFIAYRTKLSGTWQIWRWDHSGGVPVQVTHCPYDVQSFRWSDDGTRIIYEVYPPSDPAIVQRLNDDGVLLSEDIDTPWDIALPIVDAKLQRKASPQQTWIRDLMTGEDRPASAEERRRLSIYVPSYDDTESNGTGAGVWSPDHSKLVLVGTTTCGTHKCFPLVLKNGATGPSRVLTPGIHYAADPRWSADGTKVFFELYDGDGQSYPASVAIETGTIHNLVEAPVDTSIRDCSWDRTGRFGACTLQTPVTPPQIAWIDAEAHRYRSVANINPEFNNLRLGEAIPILWPNEDHMHAHLVLPTDYQRGNRYPLIITMYRDGSSFLRGAVGDEYPIQVFAANGMAVLNFDVGSSRDFRPGDFDSALSIWEAPMEGIRTVIKKLDEEGIIDPRLVAITGLSHGAEMAAYGISHTNLFLTAAMSQGGSEDLMGIFFQNGRAPREYYKRIGLVGKDGPILERWHKISASWHVAEIHCPVLLNESDREYLYFMEFYATLRDHGKPIETWIYPNENHEKNQPKHRSIIYRRNLEWMQFWLLGKENPEPADPDEYLRWRELRHLQAESGNLEVNSAGGVQAQH